jgi:cell division transport system permease protein
MSRLQFFLTEAWEMQRRDRAAGVASLTALTAVLFLLAVVLVAGYNIRNAARALQARKGIEVFLSVDCTPERIEELAGVFTGFGEVASLRFVSEEEALEEVEADLGGVDVVDALGANPLAPSFQVEVTPHAAARVGLVQDLANEIAGYDGVDEVLYGGSWLDALERGLRNVYWTTAGAGMLAALAVLLVLWNTIKLAFMGRLEAVRILKIVGATPGFIRSPYLFLGCLHAATASVLSLIFAAVVRLALTVMMPGLRFLPFSWVILFVAVAVFLGLLSSFASVEPALRTLERRHETVTR